MKYYKSQGFTLIEVVIALAVIGLALPALLMQVQSSTNHAAHMRKKTVAHWVAQNQLSEIAVAQRLGQKLPTSKQSDTVEMAGAQWTWTWQRAKTEVDNIYRIDISVSLADEDPAFSLKGFAYE